MNKNNMLGVWLALVLLIGVVSGVQAACSNPTGAEGEQVYSSNSKMMVYCNGTDWMSMGGASAGGSVSGNIAVTNVSVSTNLTVAGSTDIGWEKITGSTGASSTATCTAGKKVIGGGCSGTCYGPDANGNNGDGTPTSFPSGNTAWACSCVTSYMYGGTGTGYNLTAYAICARVN